MGSFRSLIINSDWIAHAMDEFVCKISYGLGNMCHVLAGES